MKRFVSMLLALLLVFTCAACSSTKTEQTSDSAKTTAETAATETEASAGNTAASTDPIRIGVSAAKGLAFSVDKPAVGVSTLAAMARNAAFSDGLIVCAMDARRSQVYNANFSAENGILTRLTPDRAVSLDELAEEIRNDPRPITLVGDGAHLAYARFTEQGIPCRMAPPHLIMQNATSVALEAEALAAQGKLVSAQELEAFYLRPPQADPLKKKPAPIQ